MKLSTKGRYGLRAMLDVAIYSEQEPVSIRSIAEREDLSEAYLEQLMPKMRKSGLIESQRGAQGGYRLARPAEEISVGDILRALEGELDAVSCPGLHSGNEQESCADADVCVTKYVWQRINDSIRQTVDDISLSTLVEQSHQVQENIGGETERGEHLPAEHRRACCSA